jgi:cobalt-zinc-cadmium efflux system protein
MEGIRRLVQPPEVPPVELLVFGVLGLTANIIALTVLASSRGANFNMSAAFLEVLHDALGSLGVISAAVVICWHCAPGQGTRMGLCCGCSAR